VIIQEIIKAKRDGHELSESEIWFVIDGYAKDVIPDYQMSSLLMAIFLRGFTEKELMVWTGSMIASGVRLDLSDIPGIKVDKHSTGGVGDKCSLICAPIAAACGVIVPMMSGRCLCHTGGTIDKLESIPGFRTNIPIPEFKELLRKHGLAIISQTGELAPADGKLYALRDVTGTVESIYLIASSIMSKKIAEGTDALILDVKTGSGAFMKNMDRAEALAVTMSRIGSMHGKRTMALITDMSQPLGTHAGNSLEVIESIEILKNRVSNDCSRLSIDLAAHMILLGKKAGSLGEALSLAGDAISTGSALAKFREMIEAQGGSPAVCEDYSIMGSAPESMDIAADGNGFIISMDTEMIGTAMIFLGAGRKIMGSPIDHTAGIIFHKKIGVAVRKGEPLCTMFFNRSFEGVNPEFARGLISESYKIGEKPSEKIPLILKLIEADT